MANAAGGSGGVGKGTGEGAEGVVWLEEEEALLPPLSTPTAA